ncbi:hypothetical protein PLICRDRAFT_46315 [Plicaturopsis crispa FD-325 SS-3]|uniref:Uncharacterized protein n=1 Tax=Plicaturopsis crispa FD-325 SS-3 TaxID=944288 RepID=A0A0C9T897_PLICR|nr:hypothetical protein PLICRDRAFT_46315 [Plicaturopsis crispa FD-325 SS-3]
MQTHQGSRLNRSGVHSPRPSSRTNRLPQVPSIRVPSMIDSAQENRSSPTITIIQDTLPNARTGSPLSQTSATPTQPLRALSISSREHGLLSPSGVPLEPHFSPTR